MLQSTENDRRSELLELVADHFIASGTMRESLRELAPAVGSSARMLVHYFGSRDVLVGAALEVARQRQLSAAQLCIASSTSVESMMLNAWNWYQREDTRRYFVLFNDVAAMEYLLPRSKRQFGARLRSDWQLMFEQVLRVDPRFTADSEVLARLIISTIRGLALDLHNGAKANDQKAVYFAMTELLLNR